MTFNTRNNQLSKQDGKGTEDTVQVLLGQRASVIATNYDGETSLSGAICNWHDMVAQLLREAGA